jgi:hypothetical protein
MNETLTFTKNKPIKQFYFGIQSVSKLTHVEVMKVQGLFESRRFFAVIQAARFVGNRIARIFLEYSS